MSNRSRLLFGAASAAFLGISACLLSKLDGGACAQDSDCTGAQTCLFDFGRSSSLCLPKCAAGDTACPTRCASEVNAITAYCTNRCQTDADCPPTHFCDDGTDTITSSAAHTKLCVDKVRTCQTAEVCNGLDNDCDGQIGGASCTPINGCLDDAPCGAFSCQVPAGASASICAANNAQAKVADYKPCTQDADCKNNLCETGYCAPLCRGAEFSICESGFFCARGVGPVPSGGARPAHNVCQKSCVSTADCMVPGQRCVWRDVYQVAPNHGFVCSTVDPMKKAIGQSCSGNSDAGDAECQDGLCFGNPPVCTRPCANAGESCSDVGQSFTCKMMTMLLYGAAIFIAPICVGSNG